MRRESEVFIRVLPFNKYFVEERGGKIVVHSNPAAAMRMGLSAAIDLCQKFARKGVSAEVVNVYGEPVRQSASPAISVPPEYAEASVHDGLRIPPIRYDGRGSLVTTIIQHGLASEIKGRTPEEIVAKLREHPFLGEWRQENTIPEEPVVTAPPEPSARRLRLRPGDIPR